jgi:hypothetical protein
MEKSNQFRQWIGEGGGIRSFPIFLEVAGGSKKETSPFKFNLDWLKEESFLSLVKDTWVPFDPRSRQKAGNKW